MTPIIRNAAALLANLVAVAMAIPAFALPAVQVTGPSSVFAGDTVTLNLSAYGEELTGIEAIDVQITADSPVFGPILADFSAALASGGVVPASFMPDAGALGTLAYVSAFALDDPFFFDIPLADQVNPAALLDISFLMVGFPPDPIRLDLSVMFNEEEPVLTSFIVNVAQVPEPGTWTLLSIALAGVYVIRGRLRPPVRRASPRQFPLGEAEQTIASELRQR
jgi:hypothetical protein